MDNVLVVRSWIAVLNVRGETNVPGANLTWPPKMDFASVVNSGCLIAKLVKTLSTNAKNVQGDTMPRKMELVWLVQQLTRDVKVVPTVNAKSARKVTLWSKTHAINVCRTVMNVKTSTAVQLVPLDFTGTLIKHHQNAQVAEPQFLFANCVLQVQVALNAILMLSFWQIKLASCAAKLLRDVLFVKT